jgi:hypothetical protein
MKSKLPHDKCPKVSLLNANCKIISFFQMQKYLYFKPASDFTPNYCAKEINPKSCNPKVNKIYNRKRSCIQMRFGLEFYLKKTDTFSLPSLGFTLTEM